MIIDLSKVERGTSEINAELAGMESTGEGDPVRFSEPAHLVGTLKIDIDRYEISGVLSTSAEVDCTRCMETVERELSIEFSSVFVPEEHFPSEAALEVPGDDLEIDVLAGNILDLRDVAREQMLLWIPATILCKDDCRGLCPGCGEDLNQAECKCPEDRIDPRWSELLKLKEDE
jgi:uncharacterized metal-binding protein YceD (DUF177 family)